MKQPLIPLESLLEPPKRPALNCVLRIGHTAGEKTDMLQQLWSTFQKLTGIATDQLAISLQEIPSSNAMEMGQVMPPVGQE